MADVATGVIFLAILLSAIWLGILVNGRTRFTFESDRFVAVRPFAWTLRLLLSLAVVLFTLFVASVIWQLADLAV
jgi:hypothetical protein